MKRNVLVFFIRFEELHVLIFPSLYTCFKCDILVF